MKNEILLIDIDGTLTNEVCFTKEECTKATPNLKTIMWVNEQRKNNFIVIYTARRNDLYEVTMDWLRCNGVKYHAVQFEKTPGKIVDIDAINDLQ